MRENILILNIINYDLILLQTSHSFNSKKWYNNYVVFSHEYQQCNAFLPWVDPSLACEKNRRERQAITKRHNLRDNLEDLVTFP